MCAKVGELMGNNVSSKKYKPSKTISEQIEYLKTNKNVVFNDISEEEAKDILLKYNYINVITPFKHRFAKLDSKKQVIKDDRGNHIYENQVEGIKEQIERGETLEDLPAPELWLNPEIKNFYEFDNSKELKDIKIRKYKHHGKISFPIAQ